MRVILSAWIIALMIYWITPLAIATNEPATTPATQIKTVWEGEGVGGELCLEIYNLDNDLPESAELWLVSSKRNHSLGMKKGVQCLDIEYDGKTIIQAAVGAEHIDVVIVDDQTTEYVSVELPF